MQYQRIREPGNKDPEFSVLCGDWLTLAESFQSLDRGILGTHMGALVGTRCHRWCWSSLDPVLSVGGEPLAVWVMVGPVEG